MSKEVSTVLLEIDLAAGTIGEKSLPEKWWREHLGASGVAARLFYEEKVYEVDPLGDENPLIFINGLFTGTPIPCACKMSVCAKSPLTGIWGEATVGGFFGAELRKTGYQGIVLRGKSRKLVYILVED